MCDVFIRESPQPSESIEFAALLRERGLLIDVEPQDAFRVDSIEERKPLLLALDLGTEGDDPSDFIRELRSDNRAAELPILVRCPAERRAIAVRAIKAGADDWIDSDDHPTIVFSRIQHFARYRRMALTALLNEQLAQVGRLLAGIAHEIRSPLSVIRGHADLLQMILKDNAEAGQWLDPIIRSAKLMQHRLSQLLSSVRESSTPVEPTDLGALLREALDLFDKSLDPRHPRPTTRVEMLDRVKAAVDPGRFFLALLILIENAGDAMRSIGIETGAITLRLSEEESGEARIDVLDEGPGIPEDRLRRIFDPCFSTKPGGCGYGLYLASKIIAQMNGRLEASNRPEGGARLTIWLDPSRLGG